VIIATVSEENLERLRKGYADFNRGDYEAIFELLHEGFFVRDREELPDPGVYEGPDGALSAFASAGSDFEDYSIDPVEMIDGEAWVVVVAQQRGRGRVSGAPVEGEICHLWRLAPDGRATALEAFSTRGAALTAAGGPGWPSS